MNIARSIKLQQCALLGTLLLTATLGTPSAMADVVESNVVQAPDPDTGVMQSITIDVVEVPIPVTNSPNDSVLDDFVSYDFVVSSDEAIRTASLKIEPEAGGSIVIFNATSPPFNPLIIVNNGDLPPSQAAIDFDPAIAYDTYVNLPNSNPSDVSIVGRAVRDGVGDEVLGPDMFSAQWFVDDILDGSVLNFTIARITLKKPSSQGNQAPSTVLPFLYHGFLTTGDFGGGDIMVEFSNVPVPEPATLAILAAGSLLFTRRRMA